MTRSLVTVVLVMGLVGCSADVGESEPMEAAALMSVGQSDADLVDADTAIVETAPAAADHMPQHDLSSRIFDMPEDESAANLPFDDMSIFDVTSSTTTGPTPVREEGLPPMSEQTFEPMEDMVAAEVDTRPAPRVSMGMTRASYQVQLGALPSVDSARREWIRIERQHPDLVVDQTPTIIPVQLSSQPGTVYRLRTGPFSEYEAAQKLCNKFKYQDQDCYVVKMRNPG